MTTATFSCRTRGCVFPTVGDWPQAVLLFFFHARRFDHELTDAVPVLKCSSHDMFGQAAILHFFPISLSPQLLCQD